MRATPIVKLLIIVSPLIAVLAWVASYARRDSLWVSSPTRGIVVSSSAGTVKVLGHTRPHRDGWHIHHEALPGEAPNFIDPRFRFRLYPTAVETVFPHWFLVLLMSAPGVFALFRGAKPFTDLRPRLLQGTRRQHPVFRLSVYTGASLSSRVWARTGIAL